MKTTTSISLSRIVQALRFFSIASILIFHTTAYAVGEFKSKPTSVKQPDGTELHLFVSGNRYQNRLHDAQNYTVIQNSYRYYEYANASGDSLIPSGYLVGRTDPASISGITPGLEDKREQRPGSISTRQSARVVDFMTSRLPFKGATMNPIVIFIRFAGENEFTGTTAPYDQDFNTGTHSVKNYFKWNSYNKLTINASFNGGSGAQVVSYQDSHVKEYFEPFKSNIPNHKGYVSEEDADARELELMKNATNAFKNSFPGLNVDVNNDGYVDMLCFIFSGGFTSGSILWPHGGVLTNSVTINSKVPLLYIALSSFHSDPDILSHETGHVIGGFTPDLYGMPGTTGRTLYTWDLMATETDPQQSMSAYVKLKYMGFIDAIPEITQSGTYTLSPLGDVPQAYMIRSVKENEFYVLEYRRKTASSFESQIPNTGLLIYRINTAYWGNRLGEHPELYLYRPLVDSNLLEANYSAQVGRTSITSETPTYPFLTDGTDGQLHITNITEAGNTISFTYKKECFSEMPGTANNIAFTAASNIPALTATLGIIQTTGNVQMNSGTYKAFESGSRVNLKTGFRAVAGSGFRASYYPCAFKKIPPIVRVLENTTVQVSDDQSVEYHDDVSTGLSCNVFPNPSEGQVNFELNKKLSGLGYIEVYNNTGMLVYRQVMTDAEKNHQVDLVGQASGLYHLKVISGDETATKTFLIK